MVVFITAYNRQESLTKVIEGLNYDKVVVVDDCSNPSLEVPNYVEVIRTERNNGKEGFWKTINLIFDYIKRNDINYFMIIPDDFLPYKNWKNVITLFKHIEKYDKKAVAMSAMNRRWREKCWTNFPKKIVNLGNKRFFKTQYVDGNFIANRKFLEAIDFKIEPIENHKEGKSSGVWKQVSERLHKQSYHIYSVLDNIYFETDTETNLNSKMHKWRRKPRKITASCVSIPSRTEHLERAINSLIDQVDEIRCYLNDFNKVPSFLNHHKIKVYKSQNHLGDITDRGKFYKCEEIEGYHFTFDDDIIYPPDYVNRMIKYIDKYGGVWSFHGRLLKDQKHFQSFYKGAAKIFFHCRFEMRQPVKLDIPGTGVMGYHTNDVQFKTEDLFEDRMTDILVGIACKKQGVQITGLSHTERYFIIQKIEQKDTIFGQYKNADSKQVELLNQYFVE